MEVVLLKFKLGKIWRGKILVIGVQFAKFFLTNSYKYSEITEELPVDLPKFSSPFASSVMIRQNFTPPKFSHVRYSITARTCYFIVGRVCLWIFSIRI